MSKPFGQSPSLWMNVAMPNTEPLTRDDRADVCVVGAGIAGITTAYLLAREGRSVIVLDDSAIGGGETGRTTAHLASALDDRIFKLESTHGAARTKLMVESHATAINRIEQIVTSEAIACDFERVDGFLFRPTGDTSDVLEKELDAARRAGLNVTWAERAPVESFDTGRCLRFADQGMFHPLKYLNGLAHAFLRAGGRIHTGTRVDEKYEGGRPAVIHTMDGHSVRCDSLVVATNSPAINFLEVHTKQVATRTYAIAFAIPRDSVRRALMWDTADPYHYIRTQKGDDDALDYLIVGGEDHKTGQDDAPEAHYDALEEWTRARFPFVTAVERRWSGQVLEPVDGAAFIGRYDKGEKNIFCITGDSGQGMTHGTLGAMLVTDLIMERPNVWQEIYEPARKRLGGLGGFVEEVANNVKQYADYLTPGDVSSPDDIRAGEGAVIRRGLHKVAVYRDPEGGLHEVSATCTHLGCIVGWNSAEHTWDCPCHGSRFNPVGVVINGPAVENLKAISGTPPENPVEDDGREAVTPGKPKARQRSKGAGKV